MFLARSNSAVSASFLSCIQIKPAFHIPSESSTDFIFKNFFCPFSLIIIGKLGNNTQMLNLSLEIYVTSLIRKGRKLWINRTKHNNKYCWKKPFVMAENANYIHVSKRRWRCDRDTQISRPKATKVQTWIIKDAQSVGKGVSFNITPSQFSADSRVFLYLLFLWEHYGEKFYVLKFNFKFILWEVSKTTIFTFTRGTTCRSFEIARYLESERVMIKLNILYDVLRCSSIHEWSQ